MPEGAGAPLASFFCFPGGGLDRRYFDLDAPGRSFARALAARGFAVVTIDSLGWGESSRPRDGFALVPEVIAAANARAVETLVGELEQTRPGLPRIGVGHCLGGLLAIVQQAEHEPGAELQRPMALAIVGGMIVSTALTLFVVPAAYSLLDDAVAWNESRKKRGEGLVAALRTARTS